MAADGEKMQVEIRPVKDIRVAKYNPRKISQQQMDSLKASIERFGFVDPVIVNDRTGVLVGGHQRIKAAKELGLKQVPVVAVNLDEAEEKALNVALNKISGEWDLDLLKGVLDDVQAGGLDLSLTGFTDDEWLAITGDTTTDLVGLTDADNVPDIDETVEPTTRSGDLWILGNHRLLCGDSTNRQNVERLMGGENPNLIFTDPPYGFNYTKKSDKKTIQNDGDEFERVISDALEFVCVETAYICGDAKTAHAFLRATKKLGKPKSCIVWVKPLQHRMHRYELCHELIWYWGDNGSPFYGSNVFEAKREIKNYHPTVKPVELIEFCLSSHDGKIVLDFFGGSGSTIIACERQNRHSRIMEIDPIYCDVIIKRWEDYTGKKAVLESRA